MLVPFKISKSSLRISSKTTSPMPSLSPAELPQPSVWGSLPFGNTLVVSSELVSPPTQDGFLKGGCGSYKMSVKSLIFLRLRGLDNMKGVMLCDFQGCHKRQCSWFVGICKPVVQESPCKKLPPWSCHAVRKPEAAQVERPWNYKQRVMPGLSLTFQPPVIPAAASCKCITK